MLSQAIKVLVRKRLAFSSNKVLVRKRLAFAIHRTKNNQIDFDFWKEWRAGSAVSDNRSVERAKEGQTDL